MEEIRSRYEQYAELFGQTVHVTVNRPLGSMPTQTAVKRQKRYPLNCGYITPSSVAQTDHVIPLLNEPYLRYVYVLGADQPLTAFKGKIIGIVHRTMRHAEEPPFQPDHLPRFDRLLVAPEGMEFYEPDIRQAVSFAERRGRYRLYCMYEKSCGAVVYTRSGQEEPLYLLIRNRSGHIGFPKGHVEYGEDEAATMRREIREETGLEVRLNLSFREAYRYILWNVVHKTAVYSLAEYPYGTPVTTMENEIFGDWLLPYTEARNLLSYENDRRILDHANEWILHPPKS